MNEGNDSTSNDSGAGSSINALWEHICENRRDAGRNMTIAIEEVNILRRINAEAIAGPSRERPLQDVAGAANVQAVKVGTAAAGGEEREPESNATVNDVNEIETESNASVNDANDIDSEVHNDIDETGSEHGVECKSEANDSADQIHKENKKYKRTNTT